MAERSKPAYPQPHEARQSTQILLPHARRIDVAVAVENGEIFARDVR